MQAPRTPRGIASWRVLIAPNALFSASAERRTESDASCDETPTQESDSPRLCLEKQERKIQCRSGSSWESSGRLPCNMVSDDLRYAQCRTRPSGFAIYTSVETTVLVNHVGDSPEIRRERSNRSLIDYCRTAISKAVYTLPLCPGQSGLPAR